MLCIVFSVLLPWVASLCFQCGRQCLLSLLSYRLCHVVSGHTTIFFGLVFSSPFSFPFKKIYIYYIRPCHSQHYMIYIYMGIAWSATSTASCCSLVECICCSCRQLVQLVRTWSFFLFILFIFVPRSSVVFSLLYTWWYSFIFISACPHDRRSLSCGVGGWQARFTCLVLSDAPSPWVWYTYSWRTQDGGEGRQGSSAPDRLHTAAAAVAINRTWLCYIRIQRTAAAIWKVFCFLYSGLQPEIIGTVIVQY